jgi:hypothetical protein
MQFNNYITLNKFKNKFDKNGIIKDIKRIAHNTFDYLHNGIRKIRYTDTDIIIFNKNYIILNTGGFYTNTTKNRINEFLNHGYIYQNKGIWYYRQHTEEIRFFNGIKIDINTGKVLNKNKTPKTKKLDNYNKRINKLINAYCNKINKIESLPNNISGDCLYCQSNELSQYNNDHLLSHLKEKYIMKSLILRALEHKKYNCPNFIYKIGSNNKNDRNQIINALKKYFRNNLIKH